MLLISWLVTSQPAGKLLTPLISKRYKNIQQAYETSKNRIAHINTKLQKLPFQRTWFVYMGFSYLYDIPYWHCQNLIYQQSFGKQLHITFVTVDGSLCILQGNRKLLSRKIKGRHIMSWWVKKNKRSVWMSCKTNGQMIGSSAHQANFGMSPRSKLAIDQVY